ncbi:hypothetical protein AIOL_003753 [Candidatus Rhodobacter oscarellae]|uniref:Phosphatase n=1 Tax=Candidatus Rhodobacter oscarellae TaxID=1675527 RepID=A0A0J9GZ77_9RHOB|nr:protein tyrosine phosphatase family protein [Candidatus Rhodobacter lobularis]KMW58773.1 hypothetical protein AIOL_003753 [Candidatus Rhodobacter lobularis]
MGDPTEILNFRRVSDKITLSGQPSEAQLAALKPLGVSHVMNLGPHHNKGALPDEAGSLAALGLDYVYIPVEFDAPTQDDFDAFCAEMDRLDGKVIHVHCIYNARVSAFFYRYAKEGRGGDADEAFARMDGIWRPGGVWAAFIGDEQSLNLPNRYAGEDY